MISPSRATVKVPAEGPNNNTEVKTKVSETESEAGIDGSFQGSSATNDGQGGEYQPLISHRVGEHLCKRGAHRRQAREDHPYDVGAASRRKGSLFDSSAGKGAARHLGAQTAFRYRRFIGYLGPNDYGCHGLDSLANKERNWRLVSPHDCLCGGAVAPDDRIRGVPHTIVLPQTMVLTFPQTIVSGVPPDDCVPQSVPPDD